tara:strand:+ start:727 stop:1497 length:771 start_codon:yes stop_codon:yes gene_type:complete
MKLLSKKITRNIFVKKVRNFFGYKPIYVDIGDIKMPSSVSDSFCWRTDNSYKTIFRFSNIPYLFCKIKHSSIDIVFLNKNNEEIKKISLNEINLSNEIRIDKYFLGGIEDYGTFYIYHKIKDNLQEKTILSNRCYLGFSYNENLYSFVHGNLLSSYRNLSGSSRKTDIIKTSFLSNQKYRIQNYFDNLDKSELFFANPTSKKISFLINKEKYFLNKGCSILIDVTKYKEIDITSNCYFMRPVIFNYKKNFMDVYHG